jgi:hypothetical protein
MRFGGKTLLVRSGVVELVYLGRLTYMIASFVVLVTKNRGHRPACKVNIDHSIGSKGTAQQTR